jgi:hypothetical protein
MRGRLWFNDHEMHLDDIEVTNATQKRAHQCSLDRTCLCPHALGIAALAHSRLWTPFFASVASDRNLREEIEIEGPAHAKAPAD